MSIESDVEKVATILVDDIDGAIDSTLVGLFLRGILDNHAPLPADNSHSVK